MSLLNDFIEYIKAEKLFSAKDKLLIAVSGGADSVVLCELCRQAQFDVAIAHCNFQLRDAESDADEIFVQALAAKYNVPFYTKRFDTAAYQQQKGISVQVAARELRYNWFLQLLQDMTQQFAPKACWLLTAHHADDNVETIMMNFFKGSGINGLKGMLPKIDHIIRPLLFAKKEMLLQFAQENHLAFREDASNATVKYTRNFFRHKIIPLVEEKYPQAMNNLQQNAARFREINDIYEAAVNKIIAKLCVTQGDVLQIPVLKLLKTTGWRTILLEMLKPYGFSPQQANAAAELLFSESGRFIQNDTHRLLRNRGWLILSALSNAASGIIVIEKNTDEVAFADGLLKIASLNQAPPVNPNPMLACVDSSDISFPLLLRKWKTGDYFYPLGMRKKKKLSRFFIDQKLSMLQKEHTWVIESGKRIIWIVGLRIDDRFKLQPSTSQCLQFQLTIPK